MRFTRNVHFDIKPGKEKEFRTRFDEKVVPVMKDQDGFKGELALVNDQQKGIGISLWENEQSAETYRKTAYPKVLETLEPVIQGTPRVETYTVAANTLS